MKTTATDMTVTQKTDRTFAAMATSYSLGVFNDNFFKQTVLLLAVGAGLTHLQGIATVIFALPFILCSAYAGWLADRFPKKTIVVSGKLLELIAMLFGTFGIMTTNWFCIIGMLFLMGLQSAIFGPALNGSIPEHFPANKIGHINGSLKMVTTLAILAGIACAGVILDIGSPISEKRSSGQFLIAGTVIAVSTIGLIASMGIHKYKAAAPEKPFPWAGPFHSLGNLFALKKDPILLLAVLSDSFFYFLATLVVLIINTFGIDQLGFSQSLTSLLSVALMVGVSLGAMYSSIKADTKKWTNVLIPGTFGMGICLIAAALTSGLPVDIQAYALFLFFTLTGFCGGFFLIPITSFIQVRPSKTDKGQVMAVVGFCSFIGILSGGEVYSILDQMAKPSTMLLTTGFMSVSAAVALSIVLQWNNSLIRTNLHRAISWALRCRYEVKVVGLAKLNLPNNNDGILFLANHPAWIDPVILMSVLYKKFQPRPLSDYEQTNAFYIQPLVKLINAIRIPCPAKNGRSSRQAVTDGIQKVASSLRQGDNILLYPAGRLCRSRNEKIVAKSAVHTILSQNKQQRIVLVRTRGLWGSSFSWANGSPKPFKNLKTCLWFALANLIFFGPRREVSIEFFESTDFPRESDRITINRSLEAFYNVDSLPKQHVPYFWWQKLFSVSEPDLEKQRPIGTAHSG